MIVVSLGANLGGPGGTARETLGSALTCLMERGVAVTARSRWYRSAPVPPSDQPDYINGAARVETDLDPWQLLHVMHDLEARFGRRRRVRWAARTLDLDLIDYHGFVTFNGWRGGRLQEPDARHLCLPHPRAHLRAFVLRPMAEIAPAWRHPVLGLDLPTLERGPASEQHCTPLAGEAAG